MTFLIIAWMDLRPSLRRRGHRILLAAFVALAIAAAWYGWKSFTSRQTPIPPGYQFSEEVRRQLVRAYDDARDRTVFFAVISACVVAVLLVAPVFVAGVVAAEHERRTFEFVAMTDLAAAELAASRAVSRCALLLTIPLASLPVMATGLLGGGVGFESVAAAWALLVALVAFTVCLGLLISVGTRRVGTAIFTHFVATAILFVAAPMVCQPMASDPRPLVAGAAEQALAIQPLTALSRELEPWVVEPRGEGGDLWGCAANYATAAASLLAVQCLLYRHLGLKPIRPNTARGRRRNRRVWANPIAWREVCTAAVHRRMAWMRLLTLVLVVTLTTLMAVLSFDDRRSGSIAIESLLPKLQALVATVSVLAWVLASALASNSISYEIHVATLEPLLTTSLTGTSVALGKLAGALRGSAFLLGYAVGLLGLAAAVGAISPSKAALAATAVIAPAVTAAALGVCCSARCGRSEPAAGTTLAILAAMLIVPAVAAQAFSLQGGWAPALGPADLVIRLLRDGRSRPSETAAVAAHLVIHGGLSALLVGLTARVLDGKYRVRQIPKTVPPGDGGTRRGVLPLMRIARLVSRATHG